MDNKIVELFIPGPAGPGMKTSTILLSISVIDYYSQKKNTFITTERQYVNFFIYSKLD